MTRVFRHGNKFPGGFNWWIGLQIKCTGCECVFELTKDSAKYKEYSREDIEYSSISIECPECCRWMHIARGEAITLLEGIKRQQEDNRGCVYDGYEYTSEDSLNYYVK